MSSTNDTFQYFDVTIRQEDIDSVDGWWTGPTIAFYQSRLEQKFLLASPKAKIILLQPIAGSMIANTKDILSIRGVLKDLKETTHIFLPINNRLDGEGNGQCHWSLMVFSVSFKVALHYDTIIGCNQKQAEFLTTKFETLLESPLVFEEMSDTPSEVNATDSGPLVCNIMDYLLTLLLRTSVLNVVRMNVDEWNFNMGVENERLRMAALLQDLKTSSITDLS